MIPKAVPMIPDHSAQIKAMLRSGKMMHIGGRPVIAPQPLMNANSHDRSDAIKLALAFVAIYVDLGLDLPCDPVCGRDDSAAGGGGNPAFDCGRDHADLGLVARVSPDAAAVGRGICVGRALLLDRAWLAALGGAVCGFGAGGAADRD